ncbi:uncharacterized protein [Cicer arietinum]|uniref:Uncharacterized protein LOC105851829 n=1 Tax=Cicer arietinum TaxID=3827 RepID=A0A1S3E267_CICAR|nr:uncharacterized protein LOC105851829 [Cicer arietinum]
MDVLVLKTNLDQMCVNSRSLLVASSNLQSMVRKVHSIYITKQSYIQGQFDHTLFTKLSPKGKIAVLIVCVEDIVLTGDDILEMGRLQKEPTAKFEIKDLGVLRLQNEDCLIKEGKYGFTTKKKYIIDLLEETGMSDCSQLTPTIPMDHNVKLWGEMECFY